MANRFRVLITDFLDESGVEAPVLDDVADLTLAQAHLEDDLRAVLPDADAIMLFHDVPTITDASFALAGRCRGVVRAGVGYNNVDLAAAGRRGIVVCNVPDYGTEEVADHAIMLLLALARRAYVADASMRRGEWDYRAALTAPRLRGKVFGVVGCGRIGTATALRAKAFGLDVVFFDPYQPDGYDKALGVRRVYRLDDLLGQSDFVSLHCYLSPETHHLIDAAAFARMPRGSYLINTARGPVVDQDALVAALDRGHLAGAGLDVFEREPLDDDRLRRHPELILTPHSAFYSVEGFVELRRKTAEEVRRLLLGEPPRNPVNRDLVVNPRTTLG
jgi:phosphoglycerate dehydrogenase-like enzyme